MEMGKMVCFDRNWQESKQSNFELSEVQFHWIAKYLCKIEIVENSIFVFQVLPPQDSKLLGLKKKQPCKKKGSYFCFLCFLLLNLYPFKKKKTEGKFKKKNKKKYKSNGAFTTIC